MTATEIRDQLALKVKVGVREIVRIHVDGEITIPEDATNEELRDAVRQLAHTVLVAERYRLAVCRINQKKSI